MVVPINSRFSHIFSQQLRLIAGAYKYMLAIKKGEMITTLRERKIESLTDHKCSIYSILLIFDIVF